MSNSSTVKVNKAQKILFLVASDSYLCSHRLNLAKEAKEAGFEVAVTTRVHPSHESLTQIQQAGIQVFPLHYFSRSRLNPYLQFLSLQELYKIYRAFNPTIVHHVALKPVILGSLVARISKIPKIVNALGGLGYLFTDSYQDKTFPPYFFSLTTSLKKIKKFFLKAFTTRMLKYIFSFQNSKVILQNQDDINTLIQSRSIIQNQSNVILIPGSGVDIQTFSVQPLPPISANQPIKIACVCRMLWDKGIGELIEATKIIRTSHAIPSVEILLYGAPDPDNPASIPEKQLMAWQRSGLISWQGHCNNVAKAYANCHIATLPSYREGMPKSLLEAMSCGRAIVTTDVPGCREVVQSEINGLLVPAGNAKALAQALMTLIKNESLIVKMGQASRQLVEKKFSDKMINKRIVEVYHHAY